MNNPYEVLGVGPDDDALTITTAYRRAAAACHPDRCPSPDLVAEWTERFREVQEAYETLTDPEKLHAWKLGAKLTDLQNIVRARAGEIVAAVVNVVTQLPEQQNLAHESRRRLASMHETAERQARLLTDELAAGKRIVKRLGPGDSILVKRMNERIAHLEGRLHDAKLTVEAMVMAKPMVDEFTDLGWSSSASFANFLLGGTSDVTVRLPFAGESGA